MSHSKIFHSSQVGLETSPPASCTPPPSVEVWPQWPPLAADAAPSLSPSAAARAGAETVACGSWQAPLSARPESSVSPAPGAHSLCGGQAVRHAPSARPVEAQCDCPAVI